MAQTAVAAKPPNSETNRIVRPMLPLGCNGYAQPLLPAHG
jgi:hypothetical protein